jgi:hypothetical protein
MVGSITLASEASLLLLVPASNHQVKIKCAKEIVRYLRGEARRGGKEILRCVREEQQHAATLEIPKWMFDAGLCSGMKPGTQSSVSLRALIGLRTLLRLSADHIELSVIQEQHLSSDFGGADVDCVSIEGPAGGAVFSASPAATVAGGSLSADAPLVGSDDERTPSQGLSSEVESGGVR